ncbi:MAG: flippase [Clostridiaceae bacterium]
MKLIKNYMYNITYQMLMMLLPLITAPYVARVLGAENVGIYSYSFSIACYFVTVAQLGIITFGNRSIAACNGDKKKINTTFSGIFCIQAVMAVFICILYLLFVIIFVEENKLIFYIQFLYVASSLIDISWLFFGLEKFKITVTRNAMIKILTVILTFILVKKHGDLWIYTTILAIGTFLGQLSLWMHFHKNAKFIKIKLKLVLAYIKPIVILFIPTVAVSVYRIMDKIMLGYMSESLSQVAFFEYSEKFMAICLGFINALGIIMIPRVSKMLAIGEREQVLKYIRISMYAISFVASAFAFGLTAVSPVLVPIYYGIEYMQCSNIIPLFSVSLIIISWANVTRSQYLIPSGKDKEYIIATCTGAVVNLMVNLVLIPKFGAVGAAIGTIFAELSVATIQTYLLRKELPFKTYAKSWIFPISLGATMMVLVRLFASLVGLRISIKLLLLECLVGSVFFIVSTIIYMIYTNNPLLKYGLAQIKNLKNKYKLVEQN